MKYDEAMAGAEAGYPVRRMNWRPGWEVRKEGARLCYATTAARAKSMGWTPTALDRDTADWVYVDGKGPQAAPKKRKRK